MMLTVAAVGCAVAVTVACYISCKSCSEVVEGSQVRLSKITLEICAWQSSPTSMEGDDVFRLCK